MNRNSRFNPANLLTLFRILTVPVVVLLLYMPDGRDIPFGRSVAATILFTVSAFTDLFDGYIARRYQMVTSFGKLLDPLADKLLVCAAMVMLIPSGRVPAWMVAIVVAASASESVSRIAGEVGPCSAWPRRSAAQRSPSTVSSAMINVSVGPASRSMPTRPKCWRLASAT